MDVALQLLGGVGLFLYGIKLMGDALQSLAGDRMRRLVGSLTRTPVRGVLIGTFVTMLIQSSSATTVMTVSFVHVGLMTLQQAVGVIMGANVGTTMTAQIIAFKLNAYALPLIGIGMFLALFGKSKKQRYIGNGIVGFGLLFLGMKTMEDSMSFLRGRQDLFLSFSSNPMLGVLAGTVVTMVVQSSAATIGLTIAMAAQGLFGLDVALPIVLGDNIGTTITAVLASFGSNRSAKQAAAAHVMFNIIGVTWALLTLPLFQSIVMVTAKDVSHQLANAHTLFNILNTLFFLPFTAPFARLIQWILPSSESATPSGPRFLDAKLLKASPAAAVDAVRQEIVHMGSLAQLMLKDVLQAFLENDHRMISQVNETEKAVNELNHAISGYASELWQEGLSDELSVALSSYVNGVGDIERMGDHAQNLIELFEYKEEHGLQFSKEGREELQDMFATVTLAVKLCLEAMAEENVAKAREVIDHLEEEIDRKEKTLRRQHIIRLNRGICQPSAGVVFIDILSNLERIGDHAHNVAYIVFDIARLHHDVPEA
ncbi:MAG TPA: Na/Pi cotransporter family protein [Synergistaceae bacterium]|nr:Na/Pi cotransporter family protein [Synergistaceae bacterium]HQF91098.1 Na/Pi cotransporter family protein [Synergistaceae bacterium]HQH77716.1 Na/Pi cotransporter family protein [Synergistaceae bacterium]HQK24120.1 Na/Pi cotransporter family protein [Synergistaceae bacterium]